MNVIVRRRHKNSPGVEFDLSFRWYYKLEFDSGRFEGLFFLKNWQWKLKETILELILRLAAFFRGRIAFHGWQESSNNVVIWTSKWLSPRTGKKGECVRVDDYKLKSKRGKEQLWAQQANDHIRKNFIQFIPSEKIKIATWRIFKCSLR